MELPTRYLRFQQFPAKVAGSDSCKFPTILEYIETFVPLGAQ
jgi:hypothetical protein